MATNTTNLDLKKPEQADFYNVDDFSENFQKIDDFAGRKDNPHNVTKEQLGLSKVDNTSDAEKPVSTKQAEAIADAKATGTTAQTNITTHTSNKSNPHGVTKAQVGLGNVPNVATNDQTPTYTEASTLATLTSGEKLSVAFSKIKKAITDLIAHVSKSATSSVAGHVKITDSLTSTATDTAASAKALKTVNDKVVENGFELIKTQNITTGTMDSGSSTKGVSLAYNVTGVNFNDYEELLFEFIGAASVTDKSAYTSYSGERGVKVAMDIQSKPNSANSVDTYQAPVYEVTMYSTANKGTHSAEFNNILRLKSKTHENMSYKTDDRVVTYRDGIAVAANGSVFNNIHGSLESLNVIVFTNSTKTEYLKFTAAASFTLNIYGKKGF